MRNRISLSLALLLAASFLAAAPPAAADEGTFSQTTDIDWADDTGGPALVYPSSIVVSGLGSGLVNDVNLNFTDFYHEYVSDLDILLVGPQGQSVTIMSDAPSGGGGCDSEVENIALTFDDEAAGAMPAFTELAAGTYKPTDDDGPGGSCNPTDETFPSPAPAGPHGTTLSVFDGTNANGTWNLFVVDDTNEDVGAIGFWSLDISTGTAETFSNSNAVATAETGGAATPYPSTIAVSGLRNVADVDVSLFGYSVEAPNDWDVLLVGPAGQKLEVMSDAPWNANCGTPVVGQSLVFSDEADGTIPADAVASGTFKPTQNNLAGACGSGGEGYPSPAPSGPYASSLSAFDGTNPNGTWSLYVFDDTADAATGGITGWSLSVLEVPDTTDPTAGTVNDGSAADIDTQTSTDTLHANWTGFSDDDGVDHYEFGISTSSTCATRDVVADEDVGGSSGATRSGLTLSVGTTYYSCVAALDAAGNSSGFEPSDGVTIVTGPPPGADLKAEVFDDGNDPQTAGATVIFDAVVRNLGPLPATDVVGTIELPGFGKLVSVGTDQGSCGAPSGRLISCAIGSLNATGHATVTVTMRMTHAGTYKLGLLHLDSPEDDPVANNNSNREAVTILPNGAVISGVSCTIVGTNASETLHGTPKNDTICLLEGNDVSDGKAGSDRVIGGSGADNLYGGGQGTDTVEGGGGNDTVSVRDGSGGDTVNGGGGTGDTCKKDAGDTVTGCP